MSSPIWDCGNDWQRQGEFLNNFLYVDGKPFVKGKKGTLKEHTKEELLEVLLSIHEDSWNNYNDIAKEMGWK